MVPVVGSGHFFPLWYDDVVIRGVLVVRLLAWILTAAASGSGPPAVVADWADGPILASVLLDSTFTMDHVQEADAIRQLTQLRRFVDAYQGLHIHLPPLGLAAIEAIFSILHHQQSSILLGLLILVLDLRIAYNLFVYARHAITREYIDNANEESQWQAVMEVRIQPKLQHVFCIAASTTTSTTPTTTTTTTATTSCTKGEGSSRNDDVDNDVDNSDDNNTNRSPLGFAWNYMPLYTARVYFVAASGLALLYPTAFQNLPLFFLTEALSSHHSTIVGSTFCLAISTYLDLHNVLFLIPLTNMIMTSNQVKRPLSLLQPWRRLVVTVALFTTFTVVLQCLAYVLVGTTWNNYWQVVQMTHLYSFQLVGMTPSLSILWYFAMQIFRRFARYFTIMLSLTPYTAVAPLTIRLYQYPSVLVAAFAALGVLFRPPSTLYKLVIAFCFLLTNPRSLARCKPVALVIPVAVTIPIGLYLVTYWLWLEPGTGEANFCFFQCVAYNVMVAGLFLHFIGASLCRDKAVRLTAKRHMKNLEKED